MAKHLLTRAIIICTTANGYQLCLFSASSLQISSQNSTLMRHQYYEPSLGKKNKLLSTYPFFPIQNRCANPCRYSLAINLNADEFLWSVLLKLCLTEISEGPQKITDFKLSGVRNNSAVDRFIVLKGAIHLTFLWKMVTKEAKTPEAFFTNPWMTLLQMDFLLQMLWQNLHRSFLPQRFQVPETTLCKYAAI